METETRVRWHNAGAGPIQLKRFCDAWSKLDWEHATYVELLGIKGQTESRHVLTALFSENKREDVTAAQNRVAEKYGYTLTAANAAEVTAAVLAELPALQGSRPVIDKRQTPEEAAARAAEYHTMQAEGEEKQQAERELFIRLYGSGKAVTAQPGQVIVTAQIHYDNSDTMTDYFDRHASLSPEFALLVAPTQAETERLARRAVAGIELLRGVAFEWHTEKYSMGHGNYLESEDFELPPEVQGLRSRYGGGEVTHGRWEIEFCQAYNEPIQRPAFRGYGEQTPAGSISNATVTENTEKNGIEIRFPSKPAAEVLNRLKSNGWRWSKFNQCWYKRASEEARAFAATV